MGTRKPNQRSSIYYSETDGYWHGWVVVGTKEDGSPSSSQTCAVSIPRCARQRRSSLLPSKPRAPP